MVQASLPHYHDERFDNTPEHHTTTKLAPTQELADMVTGPQRQDQLNVSVLMDIHRIHEIY